MDPKYFTNSSLQITNRKLNGDNYFQWSIVVKVFLGGLGKDNHPTDDPSEIDCTTATESDQKKVAIQKQEDYQIMSTLWNSMELSIADTSINYTSSKKIWEHFQRVHQ